MIIIALPSLSEVYFISAMNHSLFANIMGPKDHLSIGIIYNVDHSNLERTVIWN